MEKFHKNPKKASKRIRASEEERPSKLLKKSAAMEFADVQVRHGMIMSES